MRALVFDGRLQLRDEPRPIPKPRESLIKVEFAGICKTDVEITRGYMNFSGILGHEFVGIVEDSADRSLIGARVVGEINIGCDTCEFCRKELSRHCLNRCVLGIVDRNGAMAEYLTLPTANLFVVPKWVTPEAAVFTEPLAAAAEILEQVKVEPSWKVLVIGDGKLGLLVCMTLRLVGCAVVLASKHPEKAAFVKDQGVEIADLNAVQEKSKAFDMVVEASGNPTGWEMALCAVKPRGIVVLKSTYGGAFAFNPAAIVIHEITVIGSRCGAFSPAIRLLQQGLVDPTPLITAVYPLSQAEQAFERAQDKDALKVLLRVDDADAQSKKQHRGEPLSQKASPGLIPMCFQNSNIRGAFCRIGFSNFFLRTF